MLSRQWEVAPPAPDAFIRGCRGMSPVLAQVLYNRGFRDPQDASAFLYAKTDESTNPFKLKGINAAVFRIRQAIKAGEKIAVYGDFDADGVTSTALMVEALRALGGAVEPYIPHRVDEGYGLNSRALEGIAQRSVKLVITVDCGIRSVQEVEDARRAGLDVIVTDHHSLGPEIPDAYAVINPKQDNPDDPLMLAGVGVAYMLAQALYTAYAKNGARRNGTGPLNLESLLDLVAIGTVADLMPLNRIENRALVRRGLDVLNKARRPGVAALLEVSGLQPGGISAGSIGFALGPRINAAGRLDNAMLAYQLLAAPSLDEARPLAQKLQGLNLERQDITRDTHDMIRKRLQEEYSETQPIIFAADASFRSGIVGLVAGRLVDEYFRPVVVMEQGEHESRASCRSIPQFDITSALDECADLLVRHGGHALAAGFTVVNENIPALRERLTAKARMTLDGQALLPILEIDAELGVHQLHENLLREMQQLEPCGHANAAPVFALRNAHVADYRQVGSDKRHLKLKISRAGQPPLDAIGFDLGGWASDMPDRIDLAFQLELNEWQGRTTLQANIMDIQRVGER